MSDEVVIAIIGLVGAVVGSIGGVIGSYLAVAKKSREDEIKDAQREQRQSDQIDEINKKFVTIDKKLDEHNGYAQKFGQIEKDIIKISAKLEFLAKGVEK